MDKHKCQHRDQYGQECGRAATAQRQIITTANGRRMVRYDCGLHTVNLSLTGELVDESN